MIMNPYSLEPITVQATDHTGQFVIQGMISGKNWEEQYVSMHGYFGSYGPSVFAAAPELLEAAKSALFVLQIVYSRELGTNEAGAIALLSKAIDKASAPAPATIDAPVKTGEAA